LIPTRAMVLAAGLGTRMQPLTLLRPKPALPVLNRPLLAHVLEHLASHGVDHAVINTHALPEVLEPAALRWAPAGMTIVFSREREILGTAGGLGRAAEHFRGGPFYLVNSDSLTDADLTKAADAHAAARRQATMVVREHDPSAGYRPVEVARDDGPAPRLAAIGGRRWGDAGEPRTFIGIHVIEPGVLSSIPAGRPSDINAEVYPLLLDKDPGSVGAWLHAGWWFEAGTPARYLELNLEMLRRSGRNSVFAPGFFVDEEARVQGSVVGEGSRLEAGSMVDGSVLWENVTVGERTSVRGCVVSDGVSLPPGGSWRDAILMPDGEGGVAAHSLGREGSAG
jgi:NDP-sugar pyrophosphorylase family protein